METIYFNGVEIKDDVLMNDVVVYSGFTPFLWLVSFVDFTRGINKYTLDGSTKLASYPFVLNAQHITVANGKLIVYGNSDFCVVDVSNGTYTAYTTGTWAGFLAPFTDPQNTSLYVYGRHDDDIYRFTVSSGVIDKRTSVGSTTGYYDRFNTFTFSDKIFMYNSSSYFADIRTANYDTSYPTVASKQYTTVSGDDEYGTCCVNPSNTRVVMVSIKYYDLVIRRDSTSLNDLTVTSVRQTNNGGYVRIIADDTYVYLLVTEGAGMTFYKYPIASGDLVLSTNIASFPHINPFGAAINMVGDLIYYRDGTNLHTFDKDGNLVSTKTTINSTGIGQTYMGIA